MKKRIMVLLSIIVFVLGLVCIQGCQQNENPKFQNEYQAVLLTTGQVFFGKVEFVGTDYVLLKDVFYIRSVANPDTKQVSNTLIRKGNEIHGADQTYINARHIIMIEPVSPQSPLAGRIKELQSQKPQGQP
ncbi:MAG TPA: hypothetical protein PK842_05245 [Smithella sp.]|jgi:hypothetical protein|nr:hypothetical protein [Smithella sp.]OQC54143.1 MAG: hypothetical protein BWX55_00658 [Deltaproteobacteria bacterium ADurb.Bin022]HNQ65221.1 hypothetical protein [Smithella sp.]HOE31791.1 hypothetical protein [Smithella sp.]HOG09801.1 hypothetical protein [Smithella sp.]